MKFIFIAALLLALPACSIKKEKKSENYRVSFTENNCHREGVFSSMGEMCQFLKSEMEQSCVPSLARSKYQAECAVAGFTEEEIL